MIVKIDNLSHDLKGISRVNGKVTFIDNALPGEVVDIKLLEEKKCFNKGKVTSYIEKSKDRIENICPYFGGCGGCSFSGTLEYKKNIFIDIFKRYANMDITPDVIYSDNIYGYRNKISMKINNGNLSLVEENSTELVHIDKCLLCNDKINLVIKKITSANLNGLKEVIIRGTDSIMVILKGEYDYDIIIKLLEGYVDSIIYNGNCIYGDEYIISNIDEYRYAIYPESFFQVNTLMISRLYDKVKEYVGKGDKLLDLYCGAGTIGIYLADNFNKVRGIEINKDAIRGANLNKKINGIKNISFELGNANNIKIEEDTVVVDPPRSGLDDKTRNIIINSNVKKLVYVSCNPITFARDINIFKDKYDIKSVTLFDNFPNTIHMESVCLLERR